MTSEDDVELVVTGQVGLNLQATKSLSGAFVDSFYRGTDAEGHEIVLPAESTLGERLLGAIISSVNGQDVRSFHAKAICQAISKAKRPVSLKFTLDHSRIEDYLDVLDDAALPWLLEHLEDLSFYLKDGDFPTALKEKLLRYKDCERLLRNIILLRRDRDGMLQSFVKTFLLPADTTTPSVDNEEDVTMAVKQLRNTLEEHLIPSFMESTAIRRMMGYLLNFPRRRILAFIDILKDKRLLFHFYMFLSRSNRRHILLLCFVRLMEKEHSANLLDSLLLCSSVLELCKEGYLQPLKDRMDKIMSILRMPEGLSKAPHNAFISIGAKTAQTPAKISNFRCLALQLLSDVMDRLAWEYVVVIYPLFEMSKDCAILHSTFMRNKRVPTTIREEDEEECSQVEGAVDEKGNLHMNEVEKSEEYEENEKDEMSEKKKEKDRGVEKDEEGGNEGQSRKNDFRDDPRTLREKNTEWELRDGSLNDVLRTRKVPNSLTIHRRERIKPDDEANTAKKHHAINVAMFETLVRDMKGGQRGGGGRFVSSDVTEEECVTATVHLRGGVHRAHLNADSTSASSDDVNFKERNDAFHALCPFFVPTGKVAVAIRTAGQIVDNTQAPSPKLYSMVLTNRDQTPIYSCSLVLYRAVLLVSDVTLSTDRSNSSVEQSEMTPSRSNRGRSAETADCFEECSAKDIPQTIRVIAIEPHMSSETCDKSSECAQSRALSQHRAFETGVNEVEMDTIVPASIQEHSASTSTSTTTSTTTSTSFSTCTLATVVESESCSVHMEREEGDENNSEEKEGEENENECREGDKDEEDGGDDNEGVEEEDKGEEQEDAILQALPSPSIDSPRGNAFQESLLARTYQNDRLTHLHGQQSELLSALSELSVGTPAIDTLRDTRQTDCLSSDIKHVQKQVLSDDVITIGTKGPEPAGSTNFTNFSDDESAGLHSSTAESNYKSKIRSKQTRTSDFKLPTCPTKSSHGAFTVFLSATATATASVASAIALQAGALPSSSFPWTSSPSQPHNAKQNEASKGFYDTISFPMFKNMNFANSSESSENGNNGLQNLKRKYESTGNDQIQSDNEFQALNVNLGSMKFQTSSSFSNTSLTSPILDKYTFSTSPLYSPPSFLVDSRGQCQPYMFSPEREGQSLSSYPRFGLGGRTHKKISSSPHTPSQSPGRRNQNRKTRSTLPGSSRPNQLHTARQINAESCNARREKSGDGDIKGVGVRNCAGMTGRHEGGREGGREGGDNTDLTPLSASGTADSSSDPRFIARTSAPIVLTTSKGTVSMSKGDTANHNNTHTSMERSFESEKGVKGIAYVAYGISLLTEAPLIKQLRSAMSDVAHGFESEYLHCAASSCLDATPRDLDANFTESDSNKLLQNVTESILKSLEDKEDQRLSVRAIGKNNTDHERKPKCDDDDGDGCTKTGNEDDDNDEDEDVGDGESTSDENIKERIGDSAVDYDSAIVFDAISPKNLVTVLVAFLLEYRIVAVTSKALSACTHLGEWLKDAIYPLKYAHVYSPLVPQDIGLQLIHCPAPFFIGMKRSSKIDEIVESEDERDKEKSRGRRGCSPGRGDSNCGMFLIDLDRDECSMPQDLCFLLKSARHLIRELESILSPNLYGCDDLIPRNRYTRTSSLANQSHEVMRLCRRFVSTLLDGAKDSCLCALDGDEHIVLFDEVLFLQRISTRLSLRPAAIERHINAETLDSGSQNTSEIVRTQDTLTSDNQPSLLPLTTSGSRDVEKLLKCLMRTQCFSMYLTSE